jgi:transglutaminase superfamily protein
MTKDEINLILKRRIKNGDEFNHLIEKPKNQKIKLKKGDTFYSVAMMKVWVETFYKQVAKLSQILKGQTVKETCDKIHYFLYYDIQYQADGITQNLRSPANSWFNRREGIDCKSYSIFASSVLMNLGIRHYIRQIKQPHFNPRQYTHVYVVVPTDQESGKLDKGHCIIDGTIASNKEPNYTDKKDVFMNQKLPHIGLNCPSPRKGLKGTSSRTKKKTTTTKKSSSASRNRFPF